MYSTMNSIFHISNRMSEGLLYFLTSISRFAIVMETQYVFCELITKFDHIIYRVQSFAEGGLQIMLLSYGENQNWPVIKNQYNY
jgi:hypothetical protein